MPFARLSIRIQWMLDTANDAEVNGSFRGRPTRFEGVPSGPWKKYRDFVQLRFQLCKTAGHPTNCMRDAVEDAREQGYLTSAYTRSEKEKSATSSTRWSGNEWEQAASKAPVFPPAWLRRLHPPRPLWRSCEFDQCPRTRCSERHSRRDRESGSGAVEHPSGVMKGSLQGGAGVGVREPAPQSGVGAAFRRPRYARPAITDRPSRFEVPTASTSERAGANVNVRTPGVHVRTPGVSVRAPNVSVRGSTLGAEH